MHSSSKIKIAFLSVLLICSVALPAQNAPIMGWSSWNHFHINIDEKMIREQADAMISSGMYKAGYRFINIDDGYFGGRNSDGNLLTDTKKFPSGMRALTDISMPGNSKPEYIFLFGTYQYTELFRDFS